MQPSHPTPSVPDHTLLRLISSGSYGEVWLGQNALGTHRAIKIIRQASFDSARPFQREFDGIRRFEPVSRVHDGLVDILQVGLGTGWFYYVMELADDLTEGAAISAENYEARTSATNCSGKDRCRPTNASTLEFNFAQTLAFLHERGLIHRDIKPSNVIFIGNQPKLADIGLLADIHDAKTFVGTMGFIPPEGPNSEQADIYSLGKLLYEISTGKDRNDFPARLPITPVFRRLSGTERSPAQGLSHGQGPTYRSASAMAADLKMIRSGKSFRRLRYLETHVRRIKKSGVLLAALLGLFATGYYAVNQKMQHAREQKQRLIGATIAQGSSLLKQGDFLGALPSFVEALQLDSPAAAKTHQLRIGSILAASPRIERSWQLPDRPVRSCAIHRDWALVTAHGHYAQVFDLNTGKELSKHLGEGRAGLRQFHARWRIDSVGRGRPHREDHPLGNGRDAAHPGPLRKAFRRRSQSGWQTHCRWM